MVDEFFLPDGTRAKDSTDYLEAWQHLAALVSQQVGGEVYGFDPDIAVRINNVPFAIERPVALAIARLATRVEAAERERDHALATLSRMRDAENPDWDGTNAAHPAWWRGCDHGVQQTARILGEILGMPEPFTPGSFHSVRERVQTLVNALTSVQQLCQDTLEHDPRDPQAAPTAGERMIARTLLRRCEPLLGSLPPKES